MDKINENYKVTEVTAHFSKAIELLFKLENEVIAGLEKLNGVDEESTDPLTLKGNSYVEDKIISVLLEKAQPLRTYLEEKLVEAIEDSITVKQEGENRVI